MAFTLKQVVMIVFRVGRTKYAKDLTGEGARLFGGRWNHKGTACLYTSESRALAILEYTVNVGIDEIPRALSFTKIEIPDHVIASVLLKDLPGDWRQSPAPSSIKDHGNGLLKSNSAVGYKTPSVVVPQEYNVLINPWHPDVSLVKIIDIEDYPYDVRIKLV